MKSYLHPDFALNGKRFSYLELLSEALYLKENGQSYEKAIGAFLCEWLNNESFVLVQTSGSTGKPKKIVLTKEAMIASAKATGLFFDLQPNMTALLCLPADYIAGKMMLVRAMTLGLSLDVVAPNSSPLSDKKYDFVAMVPLQVSQIIDRLHLVRILLVGGTKVSVQLASDILSRNGNVYESYGMTETISHIAIKKIGEQVFTILPHIQIEQDERKCLVITAESLFVEKIQTNDIVELINDRQFIWKGRYDFVINSGGVKIFPEVVEDLLAPFFTVRFFIYGIPDARLGEKVVLLIEGSSFYVNQDIFNVLSTYQKPKEIFFVSQFVETKTNKIDRKKTIGNLT